MGKKLFLLFLVTLVVVFVAGCRHSAPTVTDVANVCLRQNVSSGQAVTINGIRYSCSLEEATQKAPDDVAGKVLPIVKTLCEENGSVWQAPTNAEWLAENVGGAPYLWKFEDTWVFDGGADTWSNFRYPGFGMLTLTPEDYWPYGESEDITVDEKSNTLRNVQSLPVTRVAFECR